MILVVLLAYQFASPVRWIETQDRLFTDYDVERLIEVGPSPTLTGMATHTLKAKYESQDDSVSRTRAIYCHAKNTKEIYYQFEDEPEVASEPASDSTSLTTTPPPPVSAPAPAPVSASASSGPVASIPDVPLKAIDTLSVIIAQKLKKPVDEVPLSKISLAETTPEKGEELPLDELGSALTTGYSGTLGKYTTSMVSRLVASKMPGRFNASAIKTHLSKAWGFGSACADGVVLLGLTMEPAKRLASDVEAKAWLDSIPIYAQRSGITLSQGGSGGARGGGSSGLVINSEEFIKFQAQQERLAEQHVELYMRYLKRNSHAGELAFDKEKPTQRLRTPQGSALRLVMELDIIFGCLTTVDREITARCISIMNRADPALLEYMQHYIDQCNPEKGPTYKLAKQFGQQLLDNCKKVVGQASLYKDVTLPTALHMEVTPKGEILYTGVVRENIRKLEAYVEEMSRTTF
ncbi:hypothetical protein BD410DRAFT_847158 [Rickenella mellea]|uniref:Uncharacterized protein n=1 Tax=Rickenella mellea TaxID=50990 RepID=A0A4Y7PD86_9AGAM|nr:hypothetical protein BD410DRAFT_847158 [Rickenella mellea]